MIIFIIVAPLLVFFLLCACIVSSRCSRIEEKQDNKKKDASTCL